MLELMRFGARFYYVLHKNSIGHLFEDLTGLISAPQNF